MVGTSQARWYSPTEPRGGRGASGPTENRPEVVVVVARGRAHEHRPAAERALDDLEPEDAAVELGARPWRRGRTGRRG